MKIPLQAGLACLDGKNSTDLTYSLVIAQTTADLGVV